VVGLAGLVAEGDETEVAPIVVTSGLRGKGIGRALLKHVVEEARKLGVR
jgi:N-acetylglutamate synthase-like GNAT family acetyltransferase